MSRRGLKLSLPSFKLQLLVCYGFNGDKYINIQNGVPLDFNPRVPLHLHPFSFDESIRCNAKQ